MAVLRVSNRGFLQNIALQITLSHFRLLLTIPLIYYRIILPITVFTCLCTLNIDIKYGDDLNYMLNNKFRRLDLKDLFMLK